MLHVAWEGWVLALRWGDVDLEAGTLRINRALSDGEFAATKTPRSRRKIALQDSTLEHRTCGPQSPPQAPARGADCERPRSGKITGWYSPPPSARPIPPQRRALVQGAAEARRTACQHPTLHDLRHTCATPLLNSNVHPKYVQELLGHASIAQTLDTYSHVLKGMDGGIGDAMDAAVG